MVRFELTKHLSGRFTGYKSAAFDHSATPPSNKCIVLPARIELASPSLVDRHLSFKLREDT